MKNETKQQQLNLDELKNILAERSFFKIIEDKKLFWTLFCKEFVGKFFFFEDFFNVKFSSPDVLQLSGHIHYTVMLQNHVEEIRHIFLRNARYKIPFSLAFIEKGNAIKTCQESLEYDISNWNGSEGLLAMRHHIFLKPSIPGVARTLSAVCTPFSKIQHVKKFHHVPSMPTAVEGYHISWDAA